MKVILKSMLLMMFFLSLGCSALLDKQATQCLNDDDCAAIQAGSICAPTGVCVSSGLGPPDCFVKPPKIDAELINSCSNSECIPFDNCATLGLCNGAALPALVARP